MYAIQKKVVQRKSYKVENDLQKKIAKIKVSFNSF